jgi:hypothetical protein
VKKSVLTILVLSALGATFAASAAEDRLAAQKRCLQAHAQLMEKPGLQTLSACWRAHGYLMGSR